MNPDLVWIVVQGLSTGWFGFLLLGRSDLIRFSPIRMEGIANYCTLIDYPKHQDYFWYFGTCLSGIAGVWIQLRLRERPVGWGRFRSATVPWWIAVLLPPLLGFLALRIDQYPSIAPLLLSVTLAVVPWSSRRIGIPLERFRGDLGPVIAWWIWVPISFALSMLVVVDSCLPYRWLDGLHEGYTLLLTQAERDGLLPGLDIQQFYGPLYTSSLNDWMRVFGMTVFSERLYFQVTDVLGAALILVSLRLVIRSPWVLTLGALLTLVVSRASGADYGWDNMLRPGLGAAAFLMCVHGCRIGSSVAILLAGGMNSLALLYGQQFGIASSIGSLVLVMGVAPDRGLPVALRYAVRWWAGCLGAGGACLTAIYGLRTVEYLQHVGGTSYLLNHLVGHLAYPLVAFPWQGGWGRAIGSAGSFFATSAIWLPGLTAGFVMAISVAVWRRSSFFERTVEAAAGVMLLVAMVPVIARPVQQMYSSMPLVTVGLIVVLDQWLQQKALRVFAVVLSVVWAGFGLTGARLVGPQWASKFACWGSPGARQVAAVPRLGLVDPDASRVSADLPAISYLRRIVPPGRPVFVAAPRHAHLLFLADRPCVAPFPTSGSITNGAAEHLMIERLKTLQPPAILFTEAGVDIPMRNEFPDLHAYIQSRYVEGRSFGELHILKKRLDIRIRK